MKHWIGIFLLANVLLFSSCKEDQELPKINMQLSQLRIGGFTLSTSNPSQNTGAPADQPVLATFTAQLDPASVQSSVRLSIKNGAEVNLNFTFIDDGRTFSGVPATPLQLNQQYVLTISNQLSGINGEGFPGITVDFTTVAGQLTVTSLKFNGVESLTTSPVINVPRNAAVEITFSNPIAPGFASASFMRLIGQGVPVTTTYTVSGDNRTVTLTPSQPMNHLNRHQVWISQEVKGANEETFTQFTKWFFTEVDPTPKFPVVSDDELLTIIQQQHFKYFWDFAHPASGMARERNTSGNLVTSGGSGFGIMAIIVGIERGFISRAEGLQRMAKILDFLEKADRFHGAWSHWIDGNTGKVIPFSTNDNGGDLVETALLTQGLLTFRQYLNPGNAEENSLINRINTLWEGIEWNWYRQNNQNTLYWHWSPDKGWAMNMQIKGWNESLIVYLLAASSPTYSIPKIVYSNGWASNGGMKNGNNYEGVLLPLGPAYGGPLFFAHYSFLGLDPRGLSDAYCSDYFIQNLNHSLINHKFCIRNPNRFVGYSAECWGLTASDNQAGYSAHSPTNDLGVITPTAALSSFPFTPVESMKALKFFYYTLGDRLWGPYGFYDAFNVTAGWTANSFLAIDQGPIIIMIENYRTGLLWDLFMSAPEIQNGKAILGFN